MLGVCRYARKTAKTSQLDVERQTMPGGGKR